MNTREKILKQSREEFFREGFRKGSLRHIAANCHLTTGAIYGYFKGKDDLFFRICEEAMKAAEQQFLNRKESYRSYKKLLELRKRGNDADDFIDETVKLHAEAAQMFFEHKNAFYLLFFKSEGSSLEKYIDHLIANDVSLFLDMYRDFYQITAISDQSKHAVKLLFTELYQGIAQIVVKYDHYTEAWRSLRIYFRFYLEGFISLILHKELE